MIRILLVIIFFVIFTSFTGCTTSKFQTISITSDPNGAIIETETGESFITPGSIKLLRNKDHILTATHPNYESMEKKLFSAKKGLFYQELEPQKVHFYFMWLEPDTATDPNMEDPNAPTERIIGYRVHQEAPGRFTKIPVYEDEPNEPVVKKKSVTKQITPADFELGLQRHSFELGSEAYHYRYREPAVMEDEGLFYGGVLNYQYRGWVPTSPNAPLSRERGTFRAEGRFASGDADYNGSLSDGTPYKINGIDYDVFETRLLFGADTLDKDWLASIYTGIGYRYSTDDSSFDPYGYKRESNYLYVPIVYQLDGKFKNNWAWGGKIEFDIFAWGKQKSHLSDVGFIDIENDQEKGYGVRGSIRFQNKTKNGVLTIEPFIRYWNIEDSEYLYIPPYNYWEPENNTTEVGIQLLWRF